MPEAMSNIAALKKFFDTPVLGMKEMGALSQEERADLADQIFAETGWPRI
jgi:hypothetical protein